jgi:beta-phosphoglucomutase-like phosphatase (HAD superfamily)
MVALSLLHALSAVVLPARGVAHRACDPRAAPVCMSAGIEALLFDCDGVLADTERDGHRVSFNQAFREKGLGFEWGVEEYGRLCEVGGGKERMAHYFNLPDNGWPEGYRTPTTEALVKPKGLPLDPQRLELVKGMHARKTKIFQELIESGVVPLRPGVLRLVDAAIAQKVPICTASTTTLTIL